MAPVLPYITEFGLQPDLEADFVDEVAASDGAPPQALGVDISFDAGGEDLLLSPDFDLLICTEAAALSQWVQNVLITKRGEEIAFPENFGSDLADIVGESSASLLDIEERVIVAVEDALLQHDRVDSVKNVTVGFIDDYRLAFEATIVLDDNAVLTFEGATAVG